MFEVSLKQKILMPVTVLLKLSFFGQNLMFLLKPPYVLLLISKEPKKLETNFSFLMKEESLVFLLSHFEVYVVLELNILWVLKISQKCPKTAHSE